MGHEPMTRDRKAPALATEPARRPWRGVILIVNRTVKMFRHIQREQSTVKNKSSEKEFIKNEAQEGPSWPEGEGLSLTRGNVNDGADAGRFPRLIVGHHLPGPFSSRSRRQAISRSRRDNQGFKQSRKTKLSFQRNEQTKEIQTLRDL